MGINGSLMSQMLLAGSSTICWLKKRAFNFFPLPQTSWRTDWAWEPLHNPEGLTHLLKEKDSYGAPALFQKYTRTTTWDSNHELLPQRKVVPCPTNDSSDPLLMDLFFLFKDEAKGACFIRTIIFTVSHVCEECGILNLTYVFGLSKGDLSPWFSQVNCLTETFFVCFFRMVALFFSSNDLL